METRKNSEPQMGLRKKIVSPKPVIFEDFKAHAVKSYLF